jgi:hypothetical protein
MADHSPEPDPRLDVLDDEGRHVTAEIPSASGHCEPGTRARAVDEALDTEPVRKAEKVTVVVPRGDFEALEQTQRRLETENVRPAGASVIVDGLRPRPPDDEPAGRTE